jgi:hypothetical protein
MPNHSSEGLYPPDMEYALLVLRFGNAEARAKHESEFRYQLQVPLHESIKLGRIDDLFPVWDNVDKRLLSVADVYARLDPKNAYWVGYQWERIKTRFSFRDN